MIAVRAVVLFFVMAIVVELPAVAQSQAEQKDPLEGFNRRVFVFNDFLDRTILKPIAKFYDRAVPAWGKRMVGNFTRNVKTPISITNSILQLNAEDTFRSLMRFVINSTIGVAGIFDVAKKIGLPGAATDFDETLKHWRVPDGPYLVLPVLAPGSVRDFTGRGADRWLNPLSYAEQLEDSSSLLLAFDALDIIDARAQLLIGEGFISGDRYTALREIYLSRRATIDPTGKSGDSSDGEDFADDPFSGDDSF